MIAALSAKFPGVRWEPSTDLPDGWRVFVHVTEPTDVSSVRAGCVLVTRCVVAGKVLYFAGDNYDWCSDRDLDETMRRLVSRSEDARSALGVSA